MIAPFQNQFFFPTTSKQEAPNFQKWKLSVREIPISKTMRALVWRLTGKKKTGWLENELESATSKEGNKANKSQNKPKEVSSWFKETTALGKKKSSNKFLSHFKFSKHFCHTYTVVTYILTKVQQQSYSWTRTAWGPLLRTETGKLVLPIKLALIT